MIWYSVEEVFRARVRESVYSLNAKFRNLSIKSGAGTARATVFLKWKRGDQAVAAVQKFR